MIYSPHTYCAILQVCGLGHDKVANGGCAGRLSKDGDPVLVSAKEVDVLVDPLQRHNLVEHAHVACALVRVQAEEAQWAQAVVDGDHDHVGDLWGE